MIPIALKNLLASEKGLAGGVLIICATVLVALDRMDVKLWTEFCQMIFLTYVAGKTVQGIGEKVVGGGSGGGSPPGGIGTSPSGIGTSPSGIGTSPASGPATEG